VSGLAATLRLFARAFAYVSPARGALAVKGALMLAASLPLLLVPWPVKLIVDHVIEGIPLGAQPLPHPAFVDALFRPFAGSPEQLLVACVVAQLALALFVGAVGMSATERSQADSQLAGGFDRASRTENEANEGSSLASGLLGLADALFTLRLTQRLNHHYRSALFARLQRLPLRAFDDASVGDALFRTLYDTPALTHAVYRIALTPLTSGVLGVCVVLAMSATFGAHPLLAELGLALLATSFLSTLPFAAATRRRAERARASGASAVATLEEGLHNVLAVQALGAADAVRDRYDRASWDAFATYRGSVALGMGAFVAGLVPAAVIAAVAFFYVGDRVIDGALSRGDFLLLMAYFALLAFACLDVGALWLRLQDAAAGLERVFALLDLPGEADGPRGAPVAPLAREIALENVAVTLPNGARLLENVSLTLRPGRITALVGPPGAGKTTLAYLLPRFLSPSAGRITWDGADLARLDLDSLRRQIAFVFQETQLFDATLAENLRLGKPDASDEELWRALALAGAADFVRALPRGLATPLGRGGGALSAGQRQRISIARALVRDASLLILDEPTSALDPETEQRLVATLREASRTRAVLMIAHRRSTLRDADEVWRVEAGGVRRTSDGGASART
jgi:ABC-type multidrug transport system fused ATPase/permease subunit